MFSQENKVRIKKKSRGENDSAEKIKSTKNLLRVCLKKPDVDFCQHACMLSPSITPQQISFCGKARDFIHHVTKAESKKNRT